MPVSSTKRVVDLADAYRDRDEVVQVLERDGGSAAAQRSSRTYGVPSAAGAPSRRRAPAVETSTSTTIVITYGSAWNSSGGIRQDAARLERERDARERAEEVRADEAERRAARTRR